MRRLPTVCKKVAFVQRSWIVLRLRIAPLSVGSAGQFIGLESRTGCPAALDSTAPKEIPFTNFLRCTEEAAKND